MLNTKAGSNNIGKMMSDNYEFFEIWKTFLKSHDSEDTLIKSMEIQESGSRELIELTIIKGPLGSEFLRKIYDETDPLSLVIKAHLFVENFLNEIIREKFRNSELIPERKDFIFSLKLDILRSKNCLDEKLYLDISKLNNLRNKFVHDLFYDISNFDMSTFYYCDGLYNRVPIKSKESKRVINIHTLRLVSFIPFIGTFNA